MKTKLTFFSRLLAVIVLVSGFSAAVLAWDVPPGRYYYDNSETQWEITAVSETTSNLWFCLGKSDAGRENSISAANRIEGTDIWYYERPVGSNTWGGAEVGYFVLSSETPVRNSLWSEAIVDYIATLDGHSAEFTQSTIGLLLRPDGTLQLMDVFFTFSPKIEGQGRPYPYVYEAATKVSDTEWICETIYGGNEFFAVSTNDPTLGNAAKGYGELEVEITPTIIGEFNIGDPIVITYTTDGIAAAPSATDAVTISAPGASGLGNNTVAKPTVFCDANGVVIKVTAKSEVQIFSVQGALINSAVTSDNYSYPLNTGVYIAKVNGVSYKIVKK